MTDTEVIHEAYAAKEDRLRDVCALLLIYNDPDMRPSLPILMAMADVLSERLDDKEAAAKKIPALSIANIPGVIVFGGPPARFTERQTKLGAL